MIFVVIVANFMDYFNVYISFLSHLKGLWPEIKLHLTSTHAKLTFVYHQLIFGIIQQTLWWKIYLISHKHILCRHVLLSRSIYRHCGILESPKLYASIFTPPRDSLGQVVSLFVSIPFIVLNTAVNSRLGCGPTTPQQQWEPWHMCEWWRQLSSNYGDSKIMSILRDCCCLSISLAWLPGRSSRTDQRSPFAHAQCSQISICGYSSTPFHRASRSTRWGLLINLFPLFYPPPSRSAALNVHPLSASIVICLCTLCHRTHLSHPPCQSKMSAIAISAM